MSVCQQDSTENTFCTKMVAAWAKKEPLESEGLFNRQKAHFIPLALAEVSRNTQKVSSRVFPESCWSLGEG